MKNGECIEYYGNGKISLKCFYKDGKRHGEYICYYEDGNIFKHYLNDEKIYEYVITKEVKQKRIIKNSDLIIICI